MPRYSILNCNYIFYILLYSKGVVQMLLLKLGIFLGIE